MGSPFRVVAVIKAARVALTVFALTCGSRGAVAGDGAHPQGAPVSPEAAMEQARELIESEQYQHAIDVLKTVEIGDGETSAKVDVMIGRIFLLIGKPAKSVDFFDHATGASSGTEAEADLGLAEAHLAMGDIAQARTSAQEALKADPDLIAAHLVLARIDQRLGKGAEAMIRLRKLRADQPDNEDVAVIMARYLAASAGPDAGAAELRGFIAQHPMAALPLDTMGLLLWHANHRTEALQARLAAMDIYRRQGSGGRADAIAQWLDTVDPSGSLRNSPAVKPPITAVKPIDQTIPPVPTPRVGAEPPAPLPAAPRNPVSAQPLPPVVESPQAAALPPPPLPLPPPRKIERAAVLPVPQPLPFPPGSPILTGSGVVIEGGRWIITNRHVIEGMRNIAVRNGTGHVRRAKVIKVSSDDDLALLEIDQPFPDHAETPLADIVDPRPGRAAVVMGYPMINLFGDEQPALTEGVVAKTMGLANDPTTFQMTAKINKGNSGGPVFDRQGHLLGVTVGKTDGADVYQKSGTMLEDMNLAIKASRIRRFLGRPASGDEPVNPELSLEDLYQKMLPRAVLVAAQK